MPECAIEIRGLTKTYPTFTLGPVDITVPSGAIYGFVGPNGAGKTTTIDLMLGIGAPDAGAIRILGLDHARHEAAVKRQVGYVSPALNFESWMRVGSAVEFIRGFHDAWDDAYCERLMDAFSLGAKAYISQLSSGARIKLALVLALSWHPRVLLLDEPTSGLDAIARREVFAELLSAVADGDRTVFISSHDLTDVERFADHIGIIRGGRVLLEGRITDVVDRFRLVDVIVEPHARFAEHPGVFVQQQDHERWRVLLDQQIAPIALVASRGARPISDAPVTLEELFVALGRS